VLAAATYSSASRSRATVTRAASRSRQAVEG